MRGSEPAEPVGSMPWRSYACVAWLPLLLMALVAPLLGYLSRHSDARWALLGDSLLLPMLWCLAEQRRRREVRQLAARVRLADGILAILGRSK